MVALIQAPTSTVNCEPRFATPRTPSRPTFGERVIAVAEKLGHELMPWQAHVALVTGELIQDPETGLWLPAYDEAFWTVPRQQGKTILDVGFEFDRALGWDAWDNKPQAIGHSGQSGSAGRKKFRDEIVPLIKRSPLWKTVERARYRAEDTGLNFHNGARLDILSTSKESGHSMVYDLAVLDEIWADSDNRREQAMDPTMATRHDRQQLLSSTAGDERSVVYNSKQAKGRAAVKARLTEGMAYFEWSADPDDDPEDLRTWQRCMPALGHTITERTVRNALRKMRQEFTEEGLDEAAALSEFSRAWLNIVQRKGKTHVIPDEIWQDARRKVAPKGRLVYGLDGQPGGSTASIAVCDERGRAEIVAHHNGVQWAVPKLVELAGKTLPVVVDATGPVGHLADDLERLGVKVSRLQPREVAYACARVYDALADRTLKVRPNLCAHCDQVPIDVAVEGAVTQPMGDGWRFSRKSTATDISPLMALCLAVGGQATITPERDTVLFAWGN